MKPLIGSWITLNHPSIAEIMADAGFDWLCVDMEHSVTDYFEAQQLIVAIQSKGIKAYVRVGENNTRIIKRVLDAGADGIIVPMVNSKEDAIKAVNAVRYPPEGKRGVGLARAQGYGFAFDEYVETVNQKIKVIAQIEHIDAINNLAEILKVGGIDGTIIGPYDLSGSLGIPGRFKNPKMEQALKKYEALSKELNKPMGYHIVQPDYTQVLEKINDGYSFIAFGVDILFLGTKCREQLNNLNENV